MDLVIILRRKVEDRDQGLVIFDLVKTRLEDHPEVKVTGHVTNHFDFEEEPPSG